MARLPSVSARQATLAALVVVTSLGLQTGYTMTQGQVAGLDWFMSWFRSNQDNINGNAPAEPSAPALDGGSQGQGDGMAAPVMGDGFSDTGAPSAGDDGAMRGTDGMGMDAGMYAPGEGGVPSTGGVPSWNDPGLVPMTGGDGAPDGRMGMGTDGALDSMSSPSAGWGDGPTSVPPFSIPGYDSLTPGTPDTSRFGDDGMKVPGASGDGFDGTSPAYPAYPTEGMSDMGSETRGDGMLMPAASGTDQSGPDDGWSSISSLTELFGKLFRGGEQPAGIGTGSDGGVSIPNGEIPAPGGNDPWNPDTRQPDGNGGGRDVGGGSSQRVTWDGNGSIPCPGTARTPNDNGEFEFDDEGNMILVCDEGGGQGSGDNRMDYPPAMPGTDGGDRRGSDGGESNEGGGWGNFWDFLTGGRGDNGGSQRQGGGGEAPCPAAPQGCRYVDPTPGVCRLDCGGGFAPAAF